MNWDDLRLLLAVSRRGSFLQAGEMLGMAASTLSRRISQLERSIGQPLVERGVDGTRLTSRGLALVEAAQNLESELTQRSTSASISGKISISAGEGFVLPVNDAIARFTSAYPGCAVDFIVAPDVLKVAKGSVDIAIRTIHLGEPSLVYRQLPSAEFGIFASANYAAELGADAKPEDAAMVDLLPPLDQLQHLKAARTAGFSRVRFRVSSFAAQLAAVQQGHGVAVLPKALATGLVEAFGEVRLPPLDVFLVTRPQALRQPHIRAFVDVLQSCFPKY